VSAPDTTGDRPCGCRVGTADRCARCATAPQLRTVAKIDPREDLGMQVALLAAQLAAVEVERDAALESARTIRAATQREHALERLQQAQVLIDEALVTLMAQ